MALLYSGDLKCLLFSRQVEVKSDTKALASFGTSVFVQYTSHEISSSRCDKLAFTHTRTTNNLTQIFGFEYGKGRYKCQQDTLRAITDGNTVPDPDGLARAEDSRRKIDQSKPNRNKICRAGDDRYNDARCNRDEGQGGSGRTKGDQGDDCQRKEAQAKAGIGGYKQVKRKRNQTCSKSGCPPGYQA
jgi:hypothetical protein